MLNKKDTDQLYKFGRKYLHLKELFPKTKKITKNLTDYQARKIHAELNKLVNMAGSVSRLEEKFVPVRRGKSAKNYMDANGIPRTAKGIILPKGADKDSKVSFYRGAVIFKRGGIDAAQFPIDATTQGTITRDIREIRDAINNDENSAYLMTGGGKIQNAYIQQRGREVPYQDATGSDEAAIIEEAAIRLFEKYSQLHNIGARRISYDNQGKAKDHGAQAHPRDWGLSVYIERRP